MDDREAGAAATPDSSEPPKLAPTDGDGADGRARELSISNAAERMEEWSGTGQEATVQVEDNAAAVEDRATHPEAVSVRAQAPAAPTTPVVPLGQLGRINSITPFSTHRLKRSTVVRLSRYLLCITIACVLIFTVICLWGLIYYDPQQHSIAWWTGGLAVAVAVPLSLHDIHMHMLHYVRPNLQRYYIRILWMVPIYAIESWLALRFKEQALWLETLRESYEAYVIYAFFKLMVEFFGGEKELQEKILDARAEAGHAGAHMLVPLCWVRPWRFRGGHFLENCRAGVWVYVVVRIVCAIVTLVAGSVAPEGEAMGYVDNTVIVLVNVAQLVAMYCLVLFYHDLLQELQPLKPLGKFLSVKAVVFLSFWQGLIIRGMTEAGWIVEKNNYTVKDISSGLQDWLLCFEMAAAAVAHHAFFSYRDFDEHFGVLSVMASNRRLAQAVVDLLPVDLAEETTHHLERIFVQPKADQRVKDIAPAGAAVGRGSPADPPVSNVPP